MYGPESPAILVNQIETGVLNLDRFRVQEVSVWKTSTRQSLRNSNSKRLSAVSRATVN